MKILAKTTGTTTALMLELIVGMLIMAAAVIVLPIRAFSADVSLLANIYVWGAVIVAVLFFGSVGFFGFVRPFLLFRKLPDVQAETDGTYLYIHGKKEAKIPLEAMEGAYLSATTPYIMSSEFVAHLFSEQYGDVIIEVPKYGKYRLRFISQARKVPGKIIELAENRLGET